MARIHCGGNRPSKGTNVTLGSAVAIAVQLASGNAVAFGGGEVSLARNAARPGARLRPDGASLHSTTR
ncbi:hypothetical protein, partial [Xanthomonas translucens]|uniref:hypothetical protein n=1 Tax=Xanthomonas campestris pv. translucens TaxID=343 RepID=UPI001E52BD8C